jgi:Predicted phage phi-C31 gp36 major capsid-like protein
MAYDNVIARGDVVMAEDYANAIIDNAKDQSITMTAFRRATVSKAQQRFPVLSALPTAYWVNGDTGLKQTTEMAWTNKYLNIEELAAIVPVPENVIDDSDFDVWGEVRPKLETAIARALDAAVIFGDSAPASFPTNVRAAAIAAGNTVQVGTNTAAEGGTFGDLDDALEAIEDDGYDPDTWAANRKLKGLLRKARNSQGDRTDRDRVNADLTSFDGDPVIYGARGLWPAQGSGVKGLIAVGLDSTQFVLGVRKDITYKVLTEAVIQDNTGAIIYNLAQQDMVGLRVTFRAGWQVANPINYDQAVEANRYPAVVLETAAGA